MLGILENERTTRNDFDNIKHEIEHGKFQIVSTFQGIIEMKISQCGQYFLVLSKNKTICKISIQNPNEFQSIELAYIIKSFCEHENQLFVSSAQGVEIFQDFQQVSGKKILEKNDIRFIATSSYCLFALSQTSLLKINFETHEIEKEISVKGKFIACNNRFVAILAISLNIFVYNHDFQVIENFSIENRFTKIVISSTNLLFAGGNSKRLQIFDCVKRTLYSEYKNITLGNISNFAVTNDSYYLVTFDKDIHFYSIPEKKKEATVKLNFRKNSSVGGLKITETPMCISNDCGRLFFAINNEIYQFLLIEKYKFSQCIDFKSPIKSLDFCGGLYVEHEKISKVDLNNYIVEEFEISDCCFTKEGKFSYTDKCLFVNGLCISEVNHCANIKKISKIRDSVITTDELGKIKILTISEIKSVEGTLQKTQKILEFSEEYATTVIGISGDFIVAKRHNQLILIKNNQIINAIEFHGAVTCFTKSFEDSFNYIEYNDWEVTVKDFFDPDFKILILPKEKFASPAKFWHITDDDNFLFIANSEILTIWSLTDYKYYGKIDYGKIDLISISNCNIYISCENILKIYPNPLHIGQDVSLLIPDNYSIKYWYNLTDLIPSASSLPNLENYSENFVLKYPTVLNDIIILPYFFNSLHLLLNYPESEAYIKQAIRSGCDYIRNYKNQGPISIAIEQQTFNTLDCFLKNVGKLLKFDPNTFYRLENDLEILNEIGSPSLLNFYNSALIVPNQKLPEFGVPMKKKKIILIESSNVLDVKNFVMETPQNTISEKDLSGKISTQDLSPQKNMPLEYRVSAFRLYLSLGSSKSLDFLCSLLDSQNEEILSSPLIESIIEYKWEKVYLFMIIQVGLINLLLLLLFLYIAKFNDGILVLVSILILNCYFFIYELLQIRIRVVEYLKNLWNLLDLIRILFIFLLPIQNEFGSWQILLYSVLIFTTWDKAITLFRVFKSTRYLMKVIRECINDIIPFLIILLYLSLTFALTIYNLRIITGENEGNSFKSAWTEAYLLNFNSFSTENYKLQQWIFFILATCANPLVLMNMIIALLSNTYSNVKENAFLADLRERLELVIEIESIYILNKGKNVKSYLQVCFAGSPISPASISTVPSNIKFMSSLLPDLKSQILGISSENASKSEELSMMLSKCHESFVSDIGPLQDSISSDLEFLRSKVLAKKSNN